MKFQVVAAFLLSMAFGEPVKPSEADPGFSRQRRQNKVATLLGKKRAVQLRLSRTADEISIADQSEALEEISVSVAAAFNEVRTAVRGIDAKCRELGDEFASSSESQRGSIADLDTQHLQNKGLLSRYETELQQLTRKETETHASYDSTVSQRAHERQAYSDWHDSKEVQEQAIDDVLEVLTGNRAVMAGADPACVLSEWTVWSGCGEHDGSLGPPGQPTLQAERRREVTSEAEGAGLPCTGAIVETGPCHDEPGPEKFEVDCVLSEWSDWSECTAESRQVGRSKHIVSHANGGGEKCHGALQETGPCAGDTSASGAADAETAGGAPVSLGGSASSGLDYIIGLFSSMKDTVAKEMEEELGKHSDGDSSLRNLVVGYKKTLQHVDIEYEVVDGHRVTAQVRVANIKYEISMRNVFIENYQAISDILRDICGKPRSEVLSEGERYLSDLQRQVGLLIPAISKMPSLGVAEDGTSAKDGQGFLQSPGLANYLLEQHHQVANRAHSPAHLVKGHALASDALRAVRALEKAAVTPPLPTLKPASMARASTNSLRVAPASLPHAALAKRVRHTAMRARGSTKGWQNLLRAAQATDPALSSAMTKLQNGDGTALRALVARTSHGKLVTNEQDLLKFYRALQAQEPAAGEAVEEQSDLNSELQHCIDEKQRLTGEVITNRQTGRQARATRDMSRAKARAASNWHQDIEAEVAALNKAKADMQTVWQPLQDIADKGSFASTLEDGFSDLSEIEAEVDAYSEHEDAPPSAAGLSPSIVAIRQSMTGLQESLASVSDSLSQAYNSFHIAIAAKANSLDGRAEELQNLEKEERSTATNAAAQYNVSTAGEQGAVRLRAALEDSCERIRGSDTEAGGE